MLKKRLFYAIPLLYFVSVTAQLQANFPPVNANLLPLFGAPSVHGQMPDEPELNFPSSKLYKLDNRTYGDINDLLEDPLVILRSQFPFVDEEARITAAWNLAAKMYAADDFVKGYGAEFEPMSSHQLYSKFDTVDGNGPGIVVNDTSIFSYVKPSFQLNLEGKGKEILWKISRKVDNGALEFVVQGLSAYSDTIELSELQNTFLSPEQEYQFEFKVIGNSDCTGWSEPFTFTVEKPFRPRKVEFDKISKNVYEISWEAPVEDPEIQYLVFASNSRDFIPTVYFDKHLKAIENKESKFVDSANLVLSTADCKITIDGEYAYYRIVPEKNGVLGNPTALIYVYDNEILQNRDILTYDSRSKSAIRLSMDMHGLSKLVKLNGKEFIKNKFISDSEWAKAEPYLIPDNHPMKERLDRIFMNRRASMNTRTMQNAGFDDPAPRGVNRPVVSRHRILNGHMVKLFLDSQSGINDAVRLTRRVVGAKSIAEAIKRLGYEKIFKVPKKFLYPLPEVPGTDPSLDRKKFVLLTKDMNILESKKNRKKWKSSKITKKTLDAVYALFEDQGLADSTFAFNIPFDNDGFIAVIDTEVHHAWPVPHEKFSKYLSSNNQNYWYSITRNRRTE